jgi:hypothetical protein
VQLNASAWLKDWVFYDTGEGRLVDVTLDRLLSADLDRDPPPVLATSSFMAVSTLGSALLSIAVMGYLWVMAPSVTTTMSAVFAGAAMGCTIAIGLGLEAMKQMRQRPGELSGRGIVIVAWVVSAVGLALGVVLFFARYGTLVAEELRKVFRV